MIRQEAICKTLSKSEIRALVNKLARELHPKWLEREPKLSIKETRERIRDGLQIFQTSDIVLKQALPTEPAGKRPRR